MLTVRSATLPFRRPALDHPTGVLFRGSGFRHQHLGHASAQAGEAGDAKPLDVSASAPPSSRAPQREHVNDAQATTAIAGWERSTDSGEEWFEEQGKQTGGPPEGLQIKEPAMSGVLFLLALIVGLSAVAWQTSRFLGGFQSRRSTAAPNATVAMAPKKQSTSSNSKAHNSKKREAARETSQQGPGSSDAAVAGSAGQAAGSAAAAAGHMDQNAGVGSRTQVQEQHSPNPGPKAGSDTNDPSSLHESAAHTQHPVEEQQHAGAEARGEQDVQAMQAETPAGSSKAPAATGAARGPTSDTATPSTGPAQDLGGADDAALKPEDVSKQSSAPHESPPGPVEPSTAEASSAAAAVQRSPPGQDVPAQGPAAGRSTPHTTASPTETAAESPRARATAPAAKASAAEKAPAPAPPAEKTAAAPASRAPEAAAAWRRFPKRVPGELGTSLQLSAEALSVRAPSAGAADLLPQGRGLPALRERAQLALRAAAAASEASQRAAACSATASAAAAQAADAAESAASAATQAQSALESEAEGAIVAAEERAQRAAGLAREAEERAAGSTASAVAYQNLAQVQASVAAKAAKALAGASSGGNGNVSSSSSSSAGHVDWTSAQDASDDVPSTSIFTALQDAWDYLVAKLRGADGRGSGGALLQSDQGSEGTRFSRQSSSADRAGIPQVDVASGKEGGSLSAALHAPPQEQPSPSGQPGEALTSGSDAAEHAAPLPGLTQAALGISSTVKSLWNKVLHLGASQGG